MPKIAIVGAGSLGFTRTLVRDILAVPEFSDSTFALVDIHQDRLDFAERATTRIVTKAGVAATIEPTLDRKRALRDADFVVSTILVDGVAGFRPEFVIPIKHGVSVNIGDTLGPSGVFRALRTMPVMLDIANDIETLCPKAYWLNYTNPMTMLSRAVQRGSSVRYVGLCHSVQGTADMLAQWAGVPGDDVDFVCAGINHQAWFLRFEHKGKDLYPKLRKAIRRKTIYQQELVRNEMFKHLGYYVTESSGHNSEYCAWFRKRKDLYRKYCVKGTNWNAGEEGYLLREYEKVARTWKANVRKQLADPKPLNLDRGHEYCSYILEAVHTNRSFRFNGNVPNHGLITNLPPDCCVEVPVLVDRTGFQPIHVGALPPQCAALNQMNVAVQEMAVEAHFTGNRELVYQACYYDPLSSAVLSLDEIRKMVDELFRAQAKRLPQFKGGRRGRWDRS